MISRLLANSIRIAENFLHFVWYTCSHRIIHISIQITHYRYNYFFIIIDQYFSYGFESIFKALSTFKLATLYNFRRNNTTPIPFFIRLFEQRCCRSSTPSRSHAIFSLYHSLCSGEVLPRAGDEAIHQKSIPLLLFVRFHTSMYSRRAVFSRRARQTGRIFASPVSEIRHENL